MAERQHRQWSLRNPHPDHTPSQGRVHTGGGRAGAAESPWIKAQEEMRRIMLDYAASVLVELRDSLPLAHHERPGIIRAIEALRHP